MARNFCTVNPKLALDLRFSSEICGAKYFHSSHNQLLIHADSDHLPSGFDTLTTRSTVKPRCGRLTTSGTRRVELPPPHCEEDRKCWTRRAARKLHHGPLVPEVSCAPTRPRGAALGSSRNNTCRGFRGGREQGTKGPHFR
jgi:hypothetical protein